MKKNSAGFTLVELMIVIAIVGILAGIGYPAYTSAVKKANRADGIDAMLAVAGRMEELYMNTDTYAIASVTALVGTDQSSEGMYTLSFESAPTAFFYRIVATPNWTDAECGALTLDSIGAKGSGTGADCW